MSYRTILFLICILFLLCPGPSGAQETDTEPESEETPAPTSVPKTEDMRNEQGLVEVNFTNVELADVVKTMAAMTGRNFILDDQAKGEITIISPTKVTPKEAYDIFLSALAVNGYTTVEVGKITRIVPLKDAEREPIPTRYKGIPADNDQMITQLVPLNNIAAEDVASSFSGLVGPDGEIIAYGSSNTVIISDFSANIRRLHRIITQLDTSGAERILEVIPLEYAEAETLAEIITELLDEDENTVQPRSRNRRRQLTKRRSRRNRRRRSTKRSSRSQNVESESNPVLLADTRTNSLVVRSNEYYLSRVKEVAAKLDRPLPGGEGRIHVIYLEYAQAEEIAATLSTIIGDSSTGASTRGNARNRNNRRNNRRNNLRNRFLGRGSRNNSRTQSGRNSLTSISGTLMASLQGQVRITADLPTNALVIVASQRDFALLQDVLDKLDIPRRQVYVEAVFMEVTMESGLDFGFEFRSTNDPSEGGVQVLGGTNYGGINQAATNPLGVAGFAVGAAEGTIEFGGQEFANIGALFRALQSDRNVNVLSTPALLTQDNEEAEIVVADNIPFVTGQIFSANNTNPTTTIERKDVGITLRMTPQINESDYVRLEIFQESSQVTDSPEGLTASQVGVTTSKRNAQTIVVVKDRQTVVLGGLMQDNSSVVESKVPILGDVPVFGALFKSSSRKNKKTNLLLFLTPYVIKDASDLEEITRMSNERMRVFRERNQVQQGADPAPYINNESMTSEPNVFRAPKDE